MNFFREKNYIFEINRILFLNEENLESKNRKEQLEIRSLILEIKKEGVEDKMIDIFLISEVKKQM